MNDYEHHLAEEARAGRLTRAELLRRAAVVGVAGSSLAAILAGCGDGGQTAPPTTTGGGGRPRRGGTLTLGSTVPTLEPDPWFTIDSGGVATAQLAGEYLVRPGPGNVLQGELATAWRPGDTPREWTFDLRDGVRFHDGSPFGADDVVSTFRTISDPATGSTALSALRGVLSPDGVERTGPLQVRFHLDRPLADFPYLVSTYTYSAVVLPRGYRRGAFVGGGVGSGPFVLREYVAGQRATFVRNERYWRDGLPYLDGVNLRYYADYQSTVLALQSGEAQLNLEVRYQGSQALLGNNEVQVLREPSSAYRAVHLRVDRPPLDSALVRRAIALCIDRPALVQGLYAGWAQAANDHAWAPVYDVPPGIPQRRQDHRAARELLARAGHPRGVQVTVTAEQFEDIPQYGLFLKQMCKPAGIDVSLDLLSQSDYYGSGADHPWLVVPVGITDWASRGTASQTISPAYRCGAIWNSAHWCNPRFERLMQEFDGELDLERRRTLAAQAARLQHDAVPALIAYWIDDLRAARRSVGGLSAGPRADLARLWLSG